MILRPSLRLGTRSPDPTAGDETRHKVPGRMHVFACASVCPGAQTALHAPAMFEVLGDRNWAFYRAVFGAR